MQHPTWFNDDFLWDYADGLLTPAQRAQVEDFLKENPAENARLMHIMQEKNALSHTPLLRPDAGFADGVMARIMAEQPQSTALSKPTDRILWGIGGVLLLFLVVSVLMVFSTPTAAPSPELPTLPSIELSPLLGSSALRYSLMLIAAFLLNALQVGH
jgi:anti-sigma factor RsiW